MKRTSHMTLVPQPRPDGAGVGIVASCDAGYAGVVPPAVGSRSTG